MRKVSPGSDPAFEATVIGQGLALDVGFMFQRSKNKLRAELLTGINGCKPYCIVYDFHTELIFGITLIGKTIPISWLNILLTRIYPPPSVTRHIVRMDVGGETGPNPDIKALLERHGYVTQPTGAGTSSQYPKAERPHQTISYGILTMIHGAALPCKYWECAFYVSLRVHTVLPHDTNTISSYHKATPKPEELSCLRMFGCMIYALAPKKLMAKLTMENGARDIFLGYGAAMKTFIYENVHTHHICRATHATFDEAELNTLPKDLSQFKGSMECTLTSSQRRAPGLGRNSHPPHKKKSFRRASPFIRSHFVVIPILCIFDNLGLILESDPLSKCHSRGS
jgi:hypothetical protein